MICILGTLAERCAMECGRKSSAQVGISRAAICMKIVSRGPPRIAVIGAGYWGRHIVRNFAELNALAAVVDPNERAIAELRLASDCPSPSFEDVLADSSIEGVAIATPAGTHFQLAKRALKAGKHLFVEKPIALQMSEATELVALAQSMNLRLMVGHVLRYHSAFKKLETLVNDGSFGRVEYIYSNRLNFGTFRGEEDILWSFCPHDISMILGLVGSEPHGVAAFSVNHPPNKIADSVIIHLSFPGGERAHVYASWLHPFKEQKFVIIGSNAMAVFDDTFAWEQKLALYSRRLTKGGGISTPELTAATFLELENDEPLRTECSHFLHCVATGETPRTDGLEALRVLNVLTRASVAMESGLATGNL
jgi:UDP-2-acetamido-3-amino-2,3-dideoxy-glucuronate N-acetyltransferase